MRATAQQGGANGPGRARGPTPYEASRTRRAAVRNAGRTQLISRGRADIAEAPGGPGGPLGRLRATSVPSQLARPALARVGPRARSGRVPAGLHSLRLFGPGFGCCLRCKAALLYLYQQLRHKITIVSYSMSCSPPDQPRASPDQSSSSPAAAAAPAESSTVLDVISPWHARDLCPGRLHQSTSTF
jgi:hypothetical protein